MDTYWKKFKKDSQHQQEEVLDWAAHLEHLQAVLQEFDPGAVLNKQIMIRCFLKSLKPSVWAQMDARSRDLNSWEKAVEKTINTEAKAMLQSSTSTCDMDSRCPRGNRPTKKEEKNSSGKIKSTDSPFADTSSGKQSFSTQQTSSNPKKDQDHQQGSRHRGRRGGQGCNTNSPSTGVNVVPTKEKDRDISKVECFNCHRKG